MLKESAITSLDNEEMYKNHFDLHSINLCNKETKLYTVIQELKHFQSLDELKRVPGVIDYLKEEKLQLYNQDCEPHEWQHSKSKTILLSATQKYKYIQQVWSQTSFHTTTE
jgi:hypothetical protein